VIRRLGEALAKDEKFAEYGKCAIPELSTPRFANCARLVRRFPENKKSVYAQRLGNQTHMARF